MTTYLWTVEGPEAFATALADLLAEDDRLAADAAGAFDMGGGQWRVESYFTGRPDTAALSAAVADRFRAVGFDPAETALRLLAGSLRPLDGTDWAAIGLDALPAVAAGRFRVFGEHNRPADPSRIGRTDLVIAASTAFGTGDHASTWLSLLALDRLLAARRRPRKVLDVGTGTGILGLALARAVPTARVLASDVDPVAVRTAEANRVGNGVDARFRALRADGLRDARFRHSGPYDLVLANILPDPLVGLAGPIVALMRPGASLVVAGLRTGEEARLIAAYGARGLRLCRRLRAKEWSSLVFRKPDRPVRSRTPQPLMPISRRASGK